MRGAVVLPLLVLVAVAGCAGLVDSGGEAPTGTDAVDGYTSLESVTGVVEYEYRSPSDASNTTLRVRQRPTERMTRQHFLAPSDLQGDVTVTNGSVSWLYDASANEVTRIALRDVEFSDTGNRVFVRRVFENVTESDEGSIVADPLLPVGPVSAGPNPAMTTADLAGPTRLSVSYLGTKTIAGRQTHGVRLDPVNSSTSGELSRYIENATYWFDAEYFFPLETTTVISIDGNVSWNSRVYRNVTFNPDLSPGTFQFTPPKNATVRTPAIPRSKSFETVVRAAANVSFEVASPEVPAGFSLDAARVSRVGNRTTVFLDYERSTHSVTISTRSPPYDDQLGGEQISLGSVNVTKLSPSDVTVFRWNCEDLGYTVRGDLAPETLEDIGRDVTAYCSHQ